MGIKHTHGFTIIEVMLFLAITGVLAAGILAGSGIAIGQQRYRDSVNSLKSLIQQQYNLTTNTVNGRSGDEACNNAVVVQPPEPVSSPQPRGTSDCLLMGRFISIGEDGQQITISNVVGYRTSANAEEEATDIAELQTNYRLSASPLNQTKELVEWSATVVEPETTTPYPVSMLIVRSPLSGVIMTFVQEGVQTDLNAMVATGISTTDKNLCLNAADGSFVGRRLAVRINGFATNQGAIEIPPESEGVCEG